MFCFLSAATAVFVLVDGLCRGCHREEKSARSGEGGHRRTAAKIQGEALQSCVILKIIINSNNL